MPVTFFPGKAAQHAADEKLAKHSLACENAGLLFLPFAVDCFGVLTPSARSTLKRIAAALEISRGYPTYLAKQIVFRRVSFAIHLGTIRQVLACQPTQSTYPSSSSLPIIPFSQRVCLNSSTHPSTPSPLPLSSCVVPSS